MYVLRTAKCFVTGNPTRPRRVQVKLGDYLRYCTDTGRKEDQPLYLFDYGFAEKCPPLARAPGSGLQAAAAGPQQVGAYSVPHLFEEDLFSV